VHLDAARAARELPRAVAVTRPRRRRRPEVFARPNVGNPSGAATRSRSRVGRAVSPRPSTSTRALIETCQPSLGDVRSIEPAAFPVVREPLDEPSLNPRWRGYVTILTSTKADAACSCTPM